MGENFDFNDEVVEEVLTNLHGQEAPALSTSEIADHHDMSKGYAQELLFYLEAHGMVATKEIGDELIWWPTGVPRLDETARGLLHNPDYSFPLSIQDIHEITSEFVDVEE